jgi:hypothetical protein
MVDFTPFLFLLVKNEEGISLFLKMRQAKYSRIFGCGRLQQVVRSCEMTKARNFQKNP